MKRNYLISVVMIMLCATSLSAQKIDGTFLIISFEETYEISQHGTKEYFWIIPTDSLGSEELVLSKLFISNFPSDNLKDCCSGVDIDPSLVFDKTEYSFEDGYLKSLEILENLISKNRRKLQTIKIKWVNKQSKKIVVYATAIKGSFCTSNYHIVGRSRDGYLGKVVLPHSDFELFDKFWELHGTRLKSRDFSQMDYDVIK